VIAEENKVQQHITHHRLNIPAPFAFSHTAEQINQHQVVRRALGAKRGSVFRKSRSVNLMFTSISPVRKRASSGLKPMPSSSSLNRTSASEFALNSRDRLDGVGQADRRHFRFIAATIDQNLLFPCLSEGKDFALLASFVS
jgi:hypothetical protein